MRRKQRTIAKSTSVRGIGLHNGHMVSVEFKPAPEDTGVVFVRVDLPGKPKIPARIEHMIQRPRRTSLRTEENAEVQTVEHLLAGLYGLKVDNLIVEIDGLEVPGMDGSAKPFVDALTKAGIVEQNAEREISILNVPIAVEDNHSSIALIPGNGNGLKLSYTLEDTRWKDSRLLQHFSLQLTPEAFASDIAPARTFCMENEVTALKEQGLGKGANFENTLVVGNDGVRENTLRFQDEFVRHKILDLIGDLYLSNIELSGHVMANKSGHALNMRFVECLRTALKDQTRHEKPLYDIRHIQKLLPHRFPMLLVDRILEVVPDKRALGLKNVTFNEEYMQGHFPGQPVMPGVLQVEAIAQVACFMLLEKVEKRNKLAFLIGIDNVKLRRTVIPGDTLIIECVAIKLKSRHGLVSGKITVNGQVVAEAEIKFMIVDADEA